MTKKDELFQKRDEAYSKYQRLHTLWYYSRTEENFRNMTIALEEWGRISKEIEKGTAVQDSAGIRRIYRAHWPFLPASLKNY